MSPRLKCDDCGRFMREAGSWALIYDRVAMELSHEHMRCPTCTRMFGAVQSNATPANGDMSPYESPRP